MKSVLHVFSFFFLLLAWSLNPLKAAEPGVPGKTVRLFTIGNSFSGNATKYLPDLAKAGGHTLIMRTAAVGGAPLELHAEKARKFEENPKDKAGLYSSGLGLREELAKEPWDFVTIQQASIKSHDFATYQPFADRLREYIAKNAPGAKLLVHQTWAYRRDDPRFTKPSDKPGEPATQEAMYRGLTEAYTKLAESFGAPRIPVGDAFYLADTDPKWGYVPAAKFEPKESKEPALPDQTHSLHMGWSWKKLKDGRSTLGMDGHHANTAGQYLGACVFYEVIFGESVVGNTFVPKGLDAEYARFLQQTAHAAVLKASGAGQKAAAAPSPGIESIPGLVAFWDFQEAMGQPRLSRMPQRLVLQEMKGPIERVDGGVFGPHSARIKRGQWFMIERKDVGALDFHGKDAQVTVAAWIRRGDSSSWQAIAGVWDETRGKRQYCLFLNAPRGTRADEMKRYPLQNRIHGHVSAVGGPTPGEQFCITYSSGATEIPLREWHCLAMRYDGHESRVYVDGRLDALEHYNPFPYPGGLFEGGTEGAPFTVGAVHRGGEWGNFFAGQIGGLAVFNRALSDAEMLRLAQSPSDSSSAVASR
jgi:hypothetical protein